MLRIERPKIYIPPNNLNHMFRCHKCGYDSPEVGSCPKCSTALEKVCPICKEEFDLCTCKSARVQTKGGEPGKSHTGVQTKQ